MAPRFACAAPAALALAATAHAGIITVGPSGAFPDIQPAIDAAQPGDVLLVEPGSYSSFVLSKALRIYAQPGASISMQPGFQAEITGIPAGEEAVVSGLALGTCPWFFCASPVPGFCYSMNVHDNAGTVLVQAQDSYGIEVENSALVVVADSQLFASKPEGCAGLSLAGPGQAVFAKASEVWIVGCTLIGGDGLTGGTSAGAGMGLRALDAAVYLAETTVDGGSGGQIIAPCLGGGPTVVGIDGRPAIEAMGSSLVKVVSGPAQTISGGSGAAGTSFCQGEGAPGIKLAGVSQLILVDSIPVTGGKDSIVIGGATHPPVEVLDAAKWVTATHIYPLLLGPAQASIGSSVDLVASGNPGAAVSLFLSFKLGPATLFPGVDGAAALDPASVSLLGSVPLDAVGLATFTLPVPALPELIGLLGAFQSVETNGAGVAISNPVAIAVFP